MTRYWVVLVAALVALISGLTTSALPGTRGAEGSSVLADLFAGRFGSLLFQLTFWVAVVALLVVIVTALSSLVHEASRSTRVGPKQAEIVSKVEPPPPRERTTPPGNGRWIELAEGCVELIDELDQNADGFDPLRRELTDHVALRLEEVLERSGIEVIKDETNFDRARHRPIRGAGAAAHDAIISETVTPGFAVGHRVLRRARVRVKG